MMSPVAAVTTTASETTSPLRLVLGWIKQDLDKGTSLKLAIEGALKLARARGLERTLLEEIGVEALEHFWRKQIGAGTAGRFPQKAGAPRVDLSQLATPGAVLETLHQVEGRYMRLGDMTRGDLVSAELYYRRIADSNVQRAEAFASLAKVMSGSKPVKDCFGETEVRRFFKDVNFSA
jgi:hypothetical protein